VSDYFEDPWLGGNGQTSYAVVSATLTCPVCEKPLVTHGAEWFCREHPDEATAKES
jgi:hypothetical protein